MLSQFLGILRPCDQYPSEPGVLKPSASNASISSRPLSALSNGGVFMGNLKPSKNSEQQIESEPDEDNVKVGNSKAFSALLSTK